MSFNKLTFSKIKKNLITSALKVSLGAVLLQALSSCGSSHDDPGLGQINKLNLSAKQEVQSLLTKPDHIVFSDVQKFVLSPSCTSCHSSDKKKEARVSLTSYAEVFGQNSRSVVTPFNPIKSPLYNSLIVAHGSLHMPPKNKPQLSEDQKNLVFQWINSGAKLKVEQAVKRPKSLKEQLQPYFDTPKTIDYILVNKIVFENNCFKCHSNDSKDADFDAVLYGQDMTSYESLFTNKGIVKNRLLDKYVSDGDGGKKKIKGSRIYRAIAVHQSMPPAKKGYEPVDSLAIKALRLWILNCAIEDYSKIKDNDTSLFGPDEDSSVIEGKVRRCEDPS